MPKGNKTGPSGLGPRTGREFGYCAGYSSPGYTKGPGMGWGRGFGRGRGYGGGRGWGRGGWSRGRRFYPEPYNQAQDNTQVPITGVSPWFTTFKPEEEVKYLEETLIGMKNEIESIEKRLGELQENNKK